VQHHSNGTALNMEPQVNDTVDNVLRLYKDVVDGVKSVPLLPPSRYRSRTKLLYTMWYNGISTLVLYVGVQFRVVPFRTKCYHIVVAPNHTTQGKTRGGATQLVL